jgi:UDP-2,4-diacetamido-2,4,6-trideoxy-beta-L-altropyranose hydrolase
MRDLVLAKREFGEAEVLFAVRDLPGNINRRIGEAGHALRLLESDDIEELVELVKRERIDTVVIDHYGIDAEMEKRLKEATGVMLWALDDTYERHYCDIVLNHNPYADPTRYEGLVPESCELRCGPEYTLLRKEFYEAKKLPRPDNRPPIRVLVAMGGVDTANLNISVAELLGEFPQVEAHIITSSANPRLKELEAYVQEVSHVTLHIDSKEVAKLMRSIHFAITTPSVTLNELSFLETPFIAIQTAENQKEMMKYLKENEYNILEHFCASQLRKTIEEMFA